jgi:hypothetical protein
VLARPVGTLHLDTETTAKYIGRCREIQHAITKFVTADYADYDGVVSICCSPPLLSARPDLHPQLQHFDFDHKTKSLDHWKLRSHSQIHLLYEVSTRPICRALTQSTQRTVTTDSM